MLNELTSNLAHHFEFGHSLLIVAKTIRGASRFNIDLGTLENSTDTLGDIGLQLSCSFSENIIVRNSRTDGNWGEGETMINLNKYLCKNPITCGDFFMIYILAAEEKFYISINCRPFCTFSYRIPLHLMDRLEIHGDIQTIKQLDHRKAYPIPFPVQQGLAIGKSFSNDIPIAFSPGHIIVITARTFVNIRGQFIIKFMESDSKREELHFNVRYHKKVVIRNSMDKNFEFGVEECDCGFPFTFNEDFNIAIAFTNEEFLFAVDGKPFCTYAYRTPNILQNLAGFKITCIGGLRMHVTRVNHIRTCDPTCTGFEKYSEFNDKSECATEIWM